jgi:hypothetical protein
MCPHSTSQLPIVPQLPPPCTTTNTYHDHPSSRYEINKAKYDQHPDLHSELLSTGDTTIDGGRSTEWRYKGERHLWQCWNGRIQMRIREELRTPVAVGHRSDESDVNPVLAQLLRHFEAYKQSGERDAAGRPDTVLSSSHSVVKVHCIEGSEKLAMQKQLDNMRAAGLTFPYDCASCTFHNTSFPDICEMCDAPNAQYRMVAENMPSSTPRGEHTHAPSTSISTKSSSASTSASSDPAGTSDGSLLPKKRAVSHSIDVASVTGGGNEDPPRKLIMVGDLHGNLTETKVLWEALGSRVGQDELDRALIVFLGDYCDRGPDTRGVIDWLIALRRSREAVGAETHFIAGNHDLSMAAFLGCLPTGTKELCYKKMHFDSTMRHR